MRLSLLFIPVFFFASFGVLSAQERTTTDEASQNQVSEYQPLAPLPGVDASSAADVGTYINTIFRLAIGLGSVLAVLMIVIGGFQYLSTDLFSSKSAGRERITNALIGLGLLLVSVIVLTTINPDLLNVDPELTQAESTAVLPAMKEDFEALEALNAVNAALSSLPPVFFGGSPPNLTIDGTAAEVATRHGVSLKSSNVRVGSLHPSMNAAIVAVSRAARELNLPRPVITSGNDSRHSTNSKHYSNKALDFRANNISLAQGRAFEERVKQYLGAGYFVDFEIFRNNPSNNHLHIEYNR